MTNGAKVATWIVLALAAWGAMDVLFTVRDLIVSVAR